MLPDSPDVRNCRSSAVCQQDAHMFARKFRILDSSVPWFQKLKSFAWRQLLVALLLIGIVVFVFFSRYMLQQVLSCSLILNLKDNTMAGRSEAHKTSNTSVEHANLSHFCKIERCNAVICSNILEKQDPGAIASSYIENTFKVSCTAARSVKLSFNDCVFPANKLRRNWLSSNVSIEELAFEKCFLSEIEEDAFSSTIYKETKKIVMVKNKLNSLRRSTFASLETLNELVIRENIIKEAQLNLLEDVASTLSSLEFSQAIEDREVLRNITGGSKLPNLQILSIRGNSLSTIDDKLFSGVPAVTSLYLDSSKIETVSEHTLEPMASSISQIILTDNSISTLPAGLLDPVISRQNFLMMIQRNPWHCVCDLKWMQDLLLSRPNIFSEIPTCETPRENARKSFTVAEFCHRSNRTTTVSSTIDTTEPNLTQINQTTTQTSNAANVNVTCSVAYTNMRTFGSRKLSSKNILQVPSRFPSFRVSKTSLERSVLVNLPDLDQGVTLLWFDNDDVERTLCCAKNVKHSYLVRDIDPKAAYTICLLDDNTPVSPLNCLAVVADPENYSKTWLTNGDKSLVVSLSILSLVLLFLFGGFLSFLLIRKYPSLLRGSKRVMLVKRRNVDAIVLPKGVDISEKEERCGEEASFSNSKLHEDEYVMPLPPERISLARRSRMFRMSSQSDWHSYVSDVEPTETQLDSWRLMRLKSELEKQKSDAPPLPPHPSDMIPSLSVTVESKDELYHTTIV